MNRMLIALCMAMAMCGTASAMDFKWHDYSGLTNPDAAGVGLIGKAEDVVIAANYNFLSVSQSGHSFAEVGWQVGPRHNSEGRNNTGYVGLGVAFIKGLVTVSAGVDPLDMHGIDAAVFLNKQLGVVSE